MATDQQLCECGCRQPAPVAKRTGGGWMAGETKRFVQGHHNRVRARPESERFWEKVDRRGPNECWEWRASCFSSGYGQFAVGDERRPVTSHRVAWMQTHGPIPAGIFVCHRCDNRKCCNPAHLFLGTPAENTADMKRKGRAAGPSPGEGHHSNKLTANDVRAIRRRAQDGEAQRALASEFGVGEAQISRIIHRRQWAHI